MAFTESSSAAEVAQLLHRLWLRVSRSEGDAGEAEQDTVLDPAAGSGFADTVVEDRFRFGSSYSLN